MKRFLIPLLSVIACATAWTEEIPKWQQMQTAVLYERDLDKVKALVKSGVDPNAPIGCGTFAPLDGALENPEMVDLLLSLGAKPHDRHLVRAVSNGFSEDAEKVVKSLMAAGISINAREVHDETRFTQAIHRVVSRSHVEMLTFLLKQDDIELDNTNVDGWTPLMIAIENGREDIVDMLLAAGADPRKKNKEGLDATGFADEQIAIRQRMKEKFQATPTVASGEASPAATLP